MNEAVLYTAIAISCLLVFLLLIWFFLRPVKPEVTVGYSRKLPTTSWEILKRPETPEFNRSVLTAEAQYLPWNRCMLSIGRKYEDAGVNAIYLLHGTFVGTDPIGVIDLLKRLYPKRAALIERQLGKRLKSHFDKVVKDTGNFLPAYIEILNQSMGGYPPVMNMDWPSGNHHADRLRGALILVWQLADDMREKGWRSKDKVLLQGHSHAGQVFAIVSNWLGDTELGRKLFPAAESLGYDLKELKKRVGLIRKLQFDFVTFGAPIRYPWFLNSKIRCLHIVNHRGDSYLAVKSLGFMTTSGGDYIQQWGIEGSDALPASSHDRLLNSQLDHILGPGWSPRLWVQRVGSGMRVSPWGKTLLVDYGDSSRFQPNAIASCFGHGIYTRFEQMIHNNELIIEHLYLHPN